MGNQQCHNGLQFCSSTERSPAARFMVDKDFRIEYFPSKTKQIYLAQQPEQKQTKLHGEQDELSSVNAGLDSKNSEISLRHQQQTRDFTQQQKSPDELVCNLIRSKDIQKNNIGTQVMNGDEMVRSNNFEGIFGRIILLVDNKVEFTDNTGNQCCEAYDPETIQKTFPMGISIASMSKTLWFNLVDERDACFGQMTGNHPTSNTTTTAKPEPQNVPYDTISFKKDSSSIKVFTGISGKVYVDKDNHVEYTDYNGEKLCVGYIQNEIIKCFPNGICFGGLKKTIWLTSKMERDICFAVMTGEEPDFEKQNEKTFPGLYGRVVLKANSKVIFTSLIGERITCDYDEEVRRVFPMGLQGGGLFKTIWFREMEDLEDCLCAMKQMLKN